MSAALSGGVAVWKRVELKYCLPAGSVEGVRRFIEPFVAADPASVRTPCGDQRVTSLYLDTTGYDFYQGHLASQADRFKLRVRYYGEAPREVAYFEVKRKVGFVIEKRRTQVPLAEVGCLVQRAGGSTQRQKVLEQPHLRWFLYLMTLHHATPRVLVTCRREAYCSQDPAENARVTFDRGMACQPVTSVTLIGDPGRWVTTPVEAGRVLLELKYSAVSPWWMRELAQRLSRHRVGHSKYVAAVGHTTGEGDGWRPHLGASA